jgi:hypothetical protein
MSRRVGRLCAVCCVLCAVCCVWRAVSEPVALVAAAWRLRGTRCIDEVHSEVYHEVHQRPNLHTYYT